MDLKSFREDKLKIKTQSEFAELIGVDQSIVSNWENNPESIDFGHIQIILEKTGVTFEELTGWKKPIPEPLSVDDTWKQVDFTKMTLSDYIKGALDQMDLPEELKESYIDDLNTGIVSNTIKPKVAIVGRSDTGKSTLINALLGSEKMPTAWTPTTSIAVYIKHIDDKPAFIEEDVWMFADHVGSENMWDERNLNDEDYCRLWKIAAGGVEILKSYGTRQGDNYDKAAGAAVVYIDAPVLRTCDIIDLPGFGTETEADDNITFATSQKADVIVYLSQANGFMRIEDITYLKRNINELPVWEKKGENTLSPLSNLFIVASQAHTVNNGNKEQLKEILDVGCSNLIKTLPPKYWDAREEASGYTYSEGGSEELRSRFFVYTTDILDICKPFNDALSVILESMPIIINSRIKSFVKDYIKIRKPSLLMEIEKYEGVVEERDRYEKLLREIEANELRRVQENDGRKNKIRDRINTLKSESKNEFTDYLSKTVNIDSVISLLSQREVKNKKESIEQFGSFFTSMLQEECESILQSKSQELTRTVNQYIEDYSNSISYVFNNNGIKLDFDAGWAFASALSNIGLIGGLGTFLATSIYGVVCAGVSIGSAIAYGLISTPIFGTIGVAVGLLIIGILGLVKLFSGGWQKSVAKKLVSEFEEKRLADSYRSGIDTFWNQTSEAFGNASLELDAKWDNYVTGLRELISSYDIDEINRRIGFLKNIESFFENIPV